MKNTVIIYNGYGGQEILTGPLEKKNFDFKTADFHLTDVSTIEEFEQLKNIINCFIEKINIKNPDYWNPTEEGRKYMAEIRQFKNERINKMVEDQIKGRKILYNKIMVEVVGYRDYKLYLKVDKKHLDHFNMEIGGMRYTWTKELLFDGLNLKLRDCRHIGTNTLLMSDYFEIVVETDYVDLTPVDLKKIEPLKVPEPLAEESEIIYKKNGVSYEPISLDYQLDVRSYHKDQLEKRSVKENTKSPRKKKRNRKKRNNG